jgi:CRISPR-associated protein Cas10/Cmr2 subtype III-B
MVYLRGEIMDKQIVVLKIYTLLHDPPFKPIILRMQKKGYRKGHKEVSKEIIEKISPSLGELKDLLNKYIEKKPIVIDYADWVASSSDRCLIAELYEEINDILHVNVLDTFEQKELNYLADELSLSQFKDKVEEFKEGFCKDLKEILGNAKNLPPNIIYHALWRSLIPLTVKYFNDSNIALLPADTRVPYYTIFDHLYTSSGLIPCLVKGNKLGIIHWEAVGTQLFIKQSRAFRDMWASSFLISLINAAVIIKLANEYGFDAIINPNMLFNPIVDLYLSSYLKKIKVDLEELRFPLTPDKGFAFVPIDKVDEYVEKIPKWINNIWKVILNSIKEYVEGRIKSLRGEDLLTYTLKEHFKKEMKEAKPEDYIEIPEGENYWEFIWKEVGLNSPIRFTCVGEKIDLTPYKIRELLKNYPSIVFRNFVRKNEEVSKAKEHIICEINKIREFIKKYTEYDENYQFYEFAVVMEALKFKKKLVSEEPRVNTESWVLKNKIYVKDKRAFCNVCYSRPAVLFFTTDIIGKIPIKEDERLCPICLVKRVLATLPIINGAIDKKSPFIRVFLEVFKWIDNSKKDTRYVEALEKATKEYHSKLLKIIRNVIINVGLTESAFEENILAVPSIDTISTMSFRLNAMRCMNKGFDIDLWNEGISKIANRLGELSSVLKDKPPIKWLKDVKENILLFFIGGEWFIEEEVRGIARDRDIKDIQESKEYKYVYHNMINEVRKKAKEYKGNTTKVRNPGKYLAIIRADGDNMGMLTSLGGEKYLKKIKDLLLQRFEEYKKDGKEINEVINYIYFVTPSYYSMISRTISAIAKKVTNVSDNYCCMVIYSGGDDVLALCPPETCLQFSNDIRQIFSRGYLEIYDNGIEGTNLTISGLTENATQSHSIHLMHILTPISKHLVESITELDEFAKGEESKNSFIVSYTPRGGGKLIAKIPWSVTNVVEYIINLVSITLDEPKLIRLEDEKIRVSNSPIKLSQSAYRDLLQTYELNEGRLSSNVIKSVFEYEVSRHKEQGELKELITFMPIDKIYCVPVRIKKEEKSNLLIEIAKASIALRNGMDSNPIMLGESI